MPDGERPQRAADRVALLIACVQLVLAVRVFARMARRSGPGLTASDRPLILDAAEPAASVTVIVPVLNEESRLAPCLDHLRDTGPLVNEILVVDGGSTDGTRGVVRSAAERDGRVRWIAAGPAPDGTNGKAWNLEAGRASASPGAGWFLTIDADVHVSPGLAQAMVDRAQHDGLAVLSGATTQRVRTSLLAVLHPAMLTTLVYRYGRPNRTATSMADVQANGQCMLIKPRALAEIGGFRPGFASVCEDVTIARLIAAHEHGVGFVETGPLAVATMYRSASEAWRNWPRSLTTRDGLTGRRTLAGLAEVVFVQAAPALISLVGAVRRPGDRSGPGSPLGWMVLVYLNRGLLVARLGVLAGTRRAYPDAPNAYWLSPLADGPAALALIVSWFRTTHRWRGHTVRRGRTPPSPVPEPELP